LPYQPAVILHEMTHSFHLQNYDEINSLIESTFEKVKDKYENLYAATSHWEYFAEISEAFFSTDLIMNDAYPFTNSQLRDHDIQSYIICTQIYLYNE